MTTTDHPSGLPEQEPTSPTAVVLCDGATWAKTGADWESPGHYCTWGGLRNLAADRGGAALFDLADLPTGLTEVQKEVVRTAWATLDVRGHDVSAGVLRDAFPDAFADDLVSARWKSGDPDEKLAELLRVAEMDGAHAVIERGGVTHSGSVEVRRDSTDYPYLAAPYRVRFCYPGCTITVTAPKPVDPTGGDPVVLAHGSNPSNPSNPDYRRVYFRAEDGTWSSVRGSLTGMWPTERLYDIERLSAQTIAELMGLG